MSLVKKVVYRIPEMDEVMVESFTYQTWNNEALQMDVYHPPNTITNNPVVVFVFGYPDGVDMIDGMSLRDAPMLHSWARLIAASGLSAVLYSTKEPLIDIYKVLGYIQENSDKLRVDNNRIGIWVNSGNTPTALTVLQDSALNYIKCAVFYYSLMMDWDNNLGIEDLGKQVEFAYPENIKPFTDLRRDTPLLVVRAGLDDVPSCNDSQDSFIKKALAENLPFTLINYPNGRHAFDVHDEVDESREIIEQTLSFLKRHLTTTQTR